MNELYHFGVKGMKWGVRKDRKRSDNKDYTESRDLLKKSPNKLSNAELRKINERLNLEQQYSNLTTTQKQRGNRFIDKVGNQMKTTAANEVSKQLMNVGKIILGAGIAYAASRTRGNGQSYSFDFARRQIGR